jgi:hypothetical protein
MKHCFSWPFCAIKPNNLVQNYHNCLLFWDENFSEKGKNLLASLSAEFKFYKIDPWHSWPHAAASVQQQFRRVMF